MNKNCPSCGHKVTGRSDKIYCSENCKSISAYERHLANEAHYLKILRILRKNRKVLKAHNKKGITIIRQEELKIQGFNEKYFTHTWKADNGKTYQFCFEFGLHKTIHRGIKKYMLIQHQKYMGE